MPRVILTLVCLCQSFCLGSAEVGFAEPGLLQAPNDGQPKIIVVRNPNATRALRAEPEVVSAMVARGLTAVTGKGTPVEAWRSLVSTQDVVGVKVHSIPGALSGTRPAVAAAVVKGLLAAGHPASQVVIWDRRASDLRAAGYEDLARELGVRCAGAADAGYDPEGPYENSLLGQLVFGDLEFGRAVVAGVTNEVAGRRSHFSRLLTKELTRHVVIAPLLNHNQAGVSGLLYTVASAATDNFHRFESSATFLARAVPEIYGNTNLADRVAIHIVDALIGQYEGGQRSWLHYSGTLNELRFGKDPVALDVLSLEELNRLRQGAGVPMITNRSDLYENARWLELGTNDLRQVEVLYLD